MQRPRRAPDNRPPGQERPAHADARRRHDPLERQARRRMHAQRLHDHRAQIGQVAHVGPPHQRRPRRPHPLRLHRGELGPQRGQRGRPPDQVVEDGAQRDGRGVGPGEHVGHRQREHALLADEARVLLVRLGEARQEVAAGASVVGAGGGGGGGGGAALGHALLGELDDGRVGVGEAERALPEAERVLEEEAVEERHLADLWAESDRGRIIEF